MRASRVSATSPKPRRAHHLSGTALAGAGALGAWPASLVALPLALAPTIAGAATITICPPTGGGVCNASTVLGSAKNSDVLDFLGGTLTLDVATPPTATYPQKATLETLPPSSTPNKLDQDGHDTVFSGVVSGSGNIEIANTKSGGSVTFSNNKNAYTGSTTVDSGATLKLGAKNAIATSSTLADNGTVDISGAGGNATITDLSGNGTVTLGSNTLMLSAGASLFAGGISGAGGLTVNGGTETLSGNNSYTGVTTIGPSGTLSIAGAGSIASSSRVTDNGTFDISGANGDVTIKGLAGSGNVKLGGNSVILAGGSPTTFSGVISGTGGVTIGSPGSPPTTFSQTFNNANTYSGATTVGSGSLLTLTKSGSIEKSSVNDGGLFDISGVSGTGTSIVSLSGAGAVNLGTNVLTLSNASGIFSGNIIGNGKNSGLTIAGGTETLNGHSSFPGTTTVNAGATLTGNGSVAGALVSFGTVRPLGGSLNTFTVGGNYTMQTTPTTTPSLNIKIGGTPASGIFGNLTVSGTVALAGALDVDLVNGFMFPQGESTYQIMNFKAGKNTVSGDFTSVSYNTNQCTPDGTDMWSCGVGLTFKDVISAVSGTVDLVVTETPEPGSLAILAGGLLGLLGLRRRWNRCFG
jgi:fibronectin-binding autotransporter adhesin